MYSHVLRAIRQYFGFMKCRGQSRKLPSNAKKVAKHKGAAEPQPQLPRIIDIAAAAFDPER